MVNKLIILLFLATLLSGCLADHGSLAWEDAYVPPKETKEQQKAETDYNNKYNFYQSQIHVLAQQRDETSDFFKKKVIEDKMLVIDRKILTLQQ